MAQQSSSIQKCDFYSTAPFLDYGVERRTMCLIYSFEFGAERECSVASALSGGERCTAELGSSFAQLAATITHSHQAGRQSSEDEEDRQSRFQVS